LLIKKSVASTLNSSVIQWNWQWGCEQNWTGSRHGATAYTCGDRTKLSTE